MTALRSELEKEEPSTKELKDLTDALQKASMKVGEAMYKASQAANASPSDGGADTAGGGAAGEDGTKAEGAKTDGANADGAQEAEFRDADADSDGAKDAKDKKASGGSSA